MFFEKTIAVRGVLPLAITYKDISPVPPEGVRGVTSLIGVRGSGRGGNPPLIPNSKECWPAIPYGIESGPDLSLSLVPLFRKE